MPKIAVLYDAGQAVLSTLDLDEVLQRILAIARDYFRLHNVAVRLLDMETQELCLRSQIGRTEARAKQRLKVGEGITGAAALRKQPVYVPDVRKDTRYVCSVPTTLSELAIPLMVRDEVVGVLDCQSDRLDHFDRETIDLLTLFSTQASMALQNAKLHALEQQRARQLQAINAVAQQCTAVLDLEELLARVCELIHQSFQSEQVSLLLREQEELVLRAHYGKLTPLVQPGMRLSAVEEPWREVLSNSAALIQNNVEQSSQHTPLFAETVCRMSVPLISFGQVLGILVLDSSRRGAFSENDIQTLESVADICSTAIQNAHYVERVKQLAYLDGLTGIFNRRFFEVRILEEIERAHRHKTGMAVIMADIDQFKQLNDDFGHLLGDEVLRQISSLFQQQLRKIDVVCRYGGEEFALLLSQTGPQHAVAVAEKLRRAVEGWQFPGVARTITISSGVAVFPDQGITRDELISAADNALYAAKQAGRNRTVGGSSKRSASAG